MSLAGVAAPRRSVGAVSTFAKPCGPEEGLFEEARFGCPYPRSFVLLSPERTWFACIRIHGPSPCVVSHCSPADWSIHNCSCRLSSGCSCHACPGNVGRGPSRPRIQWCSSCISERCTCRACRGFSNVSCSHRSTTRSLEKDRKMELTSSRRREGSFWYIFRRSGIWAPPPVLRRFGVVKGREKWSSRWALASKGIPESSCPARSYRT